MSLSGFCTKWSENEAGKKKKCKITDEHIWNKAKRTQFHLNFSATETEHSVFPHAPSHGTAIRKIRFTPAFRVKLSGFFRNPHLFSTVLSQTVENRPFLANRVLQTP